MKFKVGQRVRFKSPYSVNARYFVGPLRGLYIRYIPSSSWDDYYSVYEADKRTSWNVMEKELISDPQYIYTGKSQCQKLNETII